MTLRLRMIIGLVVLVTTGLAIFGFSTYGLYARSQYGNLDEQLRSTVSLVSRDLFEAANFAFDPPGGGDGDGGGPRGVPFGTYAELRTADGVLVDGTQLSNSGSQNVPNLAKVIGDPGGAGSIFTTGSSVGGIEWRVLVRRTEGHDQRYLTVVAIPTRVVTDSLNRLVLIESSAAGGLLLILALGSWIILRRGLRPLEDMATSTRSITAGGLSQRVEPSDGRSEVGQLGLALNTMLEELEAAFKERDATEQRLRQFLADASHELRTPLTSIHGFAELFALGADHPDLDLPVILRRIEQESARMKVLVDDLLLLARLDQPGAPEPTPLDLAVLAADACSDARAIALDRSIALDAHDSVVIRGDRDHLRQALANLVTNAIRHTPNGSPIELCARLEDRTAVVSVRDHGDGLDATTLEHAFDRFWQADSARVGNGSGLGLAIVQGIAHEHRGTVTAQNAPDGGALFTLRLPLVDAECLTTPRAGAKHSTRRVGRRSTPG
jgi:two-component system, OmpR family, sensor kinase